MELDQFRNVDLVIDKANDNFIAKQFVSEGDFSGRTLTVQLTNGGVIGKVPGAQLALRWQNKASGLTDLSAFELIDADNSIFRITYPDHMLNAGTVEANVMITHDGKTVMTKAFEIRIAKLAGEMKGIIDKQEFSYVLSVLADANKFRTDIDKKAEKGEVDKTKESIDYLKYSKAENSRVDRLETKLQNIPSASPKETFTTLDALEKKYPKGAEGVMLNVADGHWYFWNGSKWEDGGKYLSNGVNIEDPGNIIKNSQLEQDDVMPYVHINNLDTPLDIYTVDGRKWAVKKVGSGITVKVDLSKNGFIKYYPTMFSGLVLTNSTTLNDNFQYVVKLADQNGTSLKGIWNPAFTLLPNQKRSISFAIPALTTAFDADILSKATEMRVEIFNDNSVDLKATDWSITAINQEVFDDEDNLIKNSDFSSYPMPYYHTSSNEKVEAKRIDNKIWAVKKGGEGLKIRIDLAQKNSLKNVSLFFSGLILTTSTSYLDAFQCQWKLENSSSETIYSEYVSGILKMESNKEKELSFQIPRLSTKIQDEILSEAKYLAIEVKNMNPDIDLKATNWSLKQIVEHPQGNSNSELIANADMSNPKVAFPFFAPNNKVNYVIRNNKYWAEAVAKGTSNEIDVEFLYSDLGYLGWNPFKIEALINNTSAETVDDYRIVLKVFDANYNQLYLKESSKFNISGSTASKITAEFSSIANSLTTEQRSNARYVRITVYSYSGGKLGVGDLKYLPIIKNQSVEDDAVIINGDNNSITRLYVEGNLPGTEEAKTKHTGKLVRTNGSTEKLYFTLKWQGSSSLEHPKKNYRIAMFVDDNYETSLDYQPNSNFLPDDKFNLKGYYSDISYSLDSTCGKIWRDMTVNRNNLTVGQMRADNFGAVQGFPIEMYVNGVYHGLYMWNTKKGKNYFGINEVDNPKGFVIEGQGWNAEPMFNADTDVNDLDGSNFEIEEQFCTDEELRTSWYGLMKFLNSSTDADFKAQVESKIDVKAAIDYALLVMTVNSNDNTGRNICYVTYNGAKFIPWFWDFNQAWGNEASGRGFRSNEFNYLPFKDPFFYKRNNKFFSRIMEWKKDEVKDRYKELRKTTLSAENLTNTFEKEWNQITFADRKKDTNKWRQEGVGVMTLPTMLSRITERIHILDKQIEEW